MLNSIDTLRSEWPPVVDGHSLFYGILDPPFGYTLPKAFKTDYDRICLVDLFYVNRIWKTAKSTISVAEWRYKYIWQNRRNSNGKSRAGLGRVWACTTSH